MRRVTGPTAAGARVSATEQGEPAVDLFDLSGKVAIVTGGNGGIGLGIARGLASAGARVAIVGRDREKTRAAAEALAAEVGADVPGLVADVGRDEEAASVVGEVVDRLGRVDILVNNAGISIRKAPQDLEPDEWRAVLDVNL